MNSSRVVYTGFRRLAEAQSYAKARRLVGFKAEAIVRGSVDKPEYVVVIYDEEKCNER